MDNVNTNLLMRANQGPSPMSLRQRNKQFYLWTISQLLLGLPCGHSSPSQILSSRSPPMTEDTGSLAMECSFEPFIHCKGAARKWGLTDDSWSKSSLPEPFNSKKTDPLHLPHPYQMGQSHVYNLAHAVIKAVHVAIASGGFHIIYICHSEHSCRTTQIHFFDGVSLL